MKTLHLIALFFMPFFISPGANQGINSLDPCRTTIGTISGPTHVNVGFPFPTTSVSYSTQCVQGADAYEWVLNIGTSCESSLGFVSFPGVTIPVNELPGVWCATPAPQCGTYTVSVRARIPQPSGPPVFTPYTTISVTVTGCSGDGSF